MQDNSKTVISKKERYLSLRKEVESASLALSAAKTVEETLAAVTALDGMMERIKNNQDFGEIISLAADIEGTIYGLKLYETTKQSVVQLLAVLLGKIDEILAEEAKNEEVNKLQRVFAWLANNPKMIAEILKNKLS